MLDGASLIDLVRPNTNCILFNPKVDYLDHIKNLGCVIVRIEDLCRYVFSPTFVMC